MLEFRQDSSFHRRRDATNLECKVVDRKLVTKYNFFVLEVLRAWMDPRRKRPHTIHHAGEGVFVVAERRIKFPSPKTSFLNA